MFRQIIIKDGKDYIRMIKPEFEFLEYALDEAFRYSDKVGVMFWGFPEMIRYNDDTKTTSLRLYVFEKRYTDKLSACADLNMKDKIELQSFCNEIFGDGYIRIISIRYISGEIWKYDFSRAKIYKRFEYW